MYLFETIECGSSLFLFETRTDCVYIQLFAHKVNIPIWQVMLHITVAYF